MDRGELILAGREFLFPAVFHYFDEPLVIERAKDQFVWDADGRRYLDFFGGIVTVSVGHLNERVNRAIHRQTDRLQHVSTLFATEPQIALAKRIAEVSPAGKLTKSFFTNSGTEANETAVQLAAATRAILKSWRCATGGTTADRRRPRAERAEHVAGAGSAKRDRPRAQCLLLSLSVRQDLPAMRSAMRRDVKELIETATSGEIAGFIAEPIQGVGGFITPPKEYFQIVAEIVRDHGGIFISDEVQTAWGRTGGKWFGIEHYDVVPER